MSRYIMIVEDLRRQRSRISAPVRLPDEPALARQYGVARDTVRKALGVLADEEAVVRRPRHGTYLQPRVPRVRGVVGQTIGFVPPWWAASTTAWHTASVMEGLSQWADAQDCHLSILHAPARPGPEGQWLRRIRQRKLAGLVWLSPQSQQMELIHRIANVVPVVVVGRQETGRNVYHVSPDYDQAARLIDEHLVSLGHHQYGVVGTDIMGNYSQTWLEAVTQAYHARGQVFDASSHFLDIRPYDRKLLGRLLREFYLSHHPQISALVLTSSGYLEPLLADEWFRVSIGKRVSVVTIDMGLYPMQSYRPRFVFDHVVCHWNELGRHAGVRLAQVLAGQKVPPRWTRPVELVVGRSCAAHQGSQSSQNSS